MSFQLGLAGSRRSRQAEPPWCGGDAPGAVARFTWSAHYVAWAAVAASLREPLPSCRDLASACRLRSRSSAACCRSAARIPAT